MANLVRELTVPAMVNLRGGLADRAFSGAVMKVLGLAPPAVPNSYTSKGAHDLLWLGPNEWLVMEQGGNGAILERSLAEALAGIPAAVCDVSGNRSLFRISGPQSSQLIGRGCSLDLGKLDDRSCAQSLLARAQVLIIKRSDEEFDLLPRRSFATYVRDWLDAALVRL